MNAIANIQRTRISAWFCAAMLLICFESICGASTVLGPAGGPQLIDTAWGADNGAPAAGISSIVQTDDGYLWMASLGKGLLYRFDGRRFEPVSIPHTDLLASTTIYSLFAPKSGGLWLGFMFGGAALLKDGHMTVYTAGDGLPRGSVAAFTEEDDGTLWAMTSDGLARFRRHHWERLDFVSPAIAASAGQLLIDTEGTLWLAGTGAVYSMEKGSNTLNNVNVQIVGDASIAESRTGVIWLSDDTDNLRPLAKVQNTGRRPISSMHGTLIDRNDNIWVNGLSIIARVALHSEDTEPSPIQWKNKNIPLMGPNIISRKGTGSEILEDREGNVWYASPDGINRFFLPNVTHELDAPAGNLGITAGKEGDIWVAARLGEPIVNWKDGKATPSAGVHEISSLLTANDLSVWFGGAGGLIHYQGNQVSAVAPPAAYEGFEVQAMTQEPAGPLWVSLGRRGVFRLTDGKWAKKGDISTLPDAEVLSAATDRGGNVWFGYVENRMAAVEGKGATVYGENDGLDVGNVTAIYGRRTKLWIGGEHGLQFFDGKRFQTVPPNPPLELSGITGIIETAAGDLWLNGTAGIVHIEAAEMRRFLGQTAQRITGTVFNSADGLQGLGDYIRPVPTAIEGTDGRLWFATSRGVSSIDPHRIYRNPFPPPVHIRALQVGETAFDPTEGMVLPKQTTALRIEYVGLSLTMPQKVRYRYKLEEQNAEWQETQGEEANFVNLHPGSYQFRVIACNNDGVWNTTGATLKFTIPPAFTQTRGFIALCIGILLGVIWLTVKLRLRQLTARLRLRLDERLRERERIARELHDTLLQSTQGLMLRVQAVRNRTEIGDPKRDDLDAALKRADEVMAEARDRVQDLRVPEEARADLTNSLSAVGEALALGRAVTFNVSVEGTPRKLRPKCADEVFGIGREALSNAFHHAQANTIELKIVYEVRTLRISVQDNGCGIKPEILHNGARPGHWGLKGMRERAQEIGARLSIRSRLREGTEVEILVPSVFIRLEQPLGLRWLQAWRARRKNS